MERPWFYVRTPKVASSSIRAGLGPDPGSALPHEPAVRLRDADPDTWARAFRFTFARNPWDRVLSLWHMRTGGRRPFERWVHERGPTLSREGEAFSVWGMASDGVRLLVDFVGRYERLEEDYALVRRALGLPPAELKRRGTRRPDPRPYQDYYSDATAELVGDVFADDVRAFGYRFRP